MIISSLHSTLTGKLWIDEIVTLIKIVEGVKVLTGPSHLTASSVSIFVDVLEMKILMFTEISLETALTWLSLCVPFL